MCCFGFFCTVLSVGDIVEKREEVWGGWIVGKWIPGK